MPDPLAPENRPMNLQGVMPDVFHCNEPEVLVSGPRGTSKTYTDMMRTLALCELYPGSRHLFSRFVRVHMNETVLETWERLLGPGHPALNGPTKEHRSVYQVGKSSVIVKGLDDPIATNSGEYDTITLFEATDIPEQTYNNLFGTLRHKKMIASDGKPWHQMRVECNPTYPQHWIKKRADAGKMVHFPTTHKDNPAYWDPIVQKWTDEGQNYISGLQRMTGVIYKRNYLGLWVGAEGMIFEDWDDDVHLVDELPEGSHKWWRVRSIDFGYTNPSVCQWWAVDPQRRMWLERELVRVNTDSVEFAKEIIDNTPEPGLIYRTVADHEDANARAILTRAGVQTVGCDKPKSLTDWPVHLGSMMRRLRDRTMFVKRGSLIDRDPRATGPIGFAEEVTGYAWAPPVEGKAPKEKPVDKDDHSMAAGRYATRFIDAHLPAGSLPPEAPVVNPHAYDGPTERKAATWVSKRFGGRR